MNGWSKPTAMAMALKPDHYVMPCPRCATVILAPRRSFGGELRYCEECARILRKET